MDFLRGDALRQEATEEGTERIILGSVEIRAVLEREGIPPEAVVDYHRYPIADNDSPRLSADRLEYTLGNLENFGLRSVDLLKCYYRDLSVSENEDGEAELAFSRLSVAEAFGHDALRCSRIYVSDEDRYAMQMLSELLGRAIRRGVLAEADLMTTEPEVIRKLLRDPQCREEWRSFSALGQMIREEERAPEPLRRVIPAKKRCIDPWVRGEGRLSRLSPSFAEDLERFLNQDQSGWLCAE